MFLRETQLKKLMKEAYKHQGLIIANTEERIYLAGGYWEIDILKKKMPKTILAQIIELAGELPDIGERFSSTKEGNQLEIEKTMKVEIKQEPISLCVTNLIFESRHLVRLRVLQNPFGKIILINNDGIGMVSKNIVNEESGEAEPVGPMYISHEGIYWWNNWMRFRYNEHIVENEDAQLIGNLEGLKLCRD